MTQQNGKISLGIKEWVIAAVVLIGHTAFVMTWLQNQNTEILNKTIENRLKITEIEGTRYTSADARVDREKLADKIDSLLLALSDIRSSSPLIRRDIDDITKRLDRIEAAVGKP